MSSVAWHPDGRAATTDLRAGVRAMTPVALAYVPFALVVGAAAGASANPLAAWLATWTIYGGAAQLAVLNLLAQGAPWVQAAVVGLLVNSRLAAYATAMAPDWRSAHLAQRALAALMLTDAPWALAADRGRERRHFYLGAAATLFLAWPLLVTVGLLVSDRLVAAPAAFLLPSLTIGAVVMPQLRERGTGVLAAGVAVWAATTSGLPDGPVLGVVAVVGAVAGLLSERAS